MHYNMGGESVTVDFPNAALSSDMMSDNLESAKDGDIRLCPLCNSEIRLFFINFNEKILMCENTQCEFPFGHEELQFVKENSDDEVSSVDDEVSSQKSRTNVSPSGTASMVSCNAWSEINHINSITEVDECMPETGVINVSECNIDQEQRKKREYAEKIRRHIEDIKELNEELTVDAEEVKETKIKNEKWIRNLKNLQEMSGVQLLKPEEMGLLKKEEPEIGLGELKIDIDPGNSSSMSTIKIQIHNSCKEEDTELQEKSSDTLQPTGKDPLPV